MKTYSEKLKHPYWQKKRLKIFERDNFTCRYCQDTESTLHVHHNKYIGKNPQDTPNEFLITLCEDCHEIAEGLKSTLKELNTEIEWCHIHFFQKNGKKRKVARIFKLKNGQKLLLFNYEEYQYNLPSFSPQSFQELKNFIANG